MEAKLEPQGASEDDCLLRFEDRVHLLTIEAKQESCVVRVILVLFIPVGRGVATEPPLGILSLTKDKQRTLILAHGLEVCTGPPVFICAPQEKLCLDFKAVGSTLYRLI